MNILYICNSMQMGGSPMGIITEIKELIKDNNNIIVVSKGGELEKELEKMKVKHFTENVPIFSKPYEPLNKKQVFKFSAENILKSLRRLRIFKTVNLVEKLIREYKIDVIYSCQPGPTQVAHIASLRTGVPFIIRVQHILLNEFPPILYKKVVKDSSMISVITKEIKYKLENFYGILDKEIRVIPTGVDLNSYLDIENDENIIFPSDLKGKIENKTVILSISTHAKSKYLPILNLCKAMEKIYESNNNVVCVLVGDGECRNIIEEEANRINLKVGKEIIILVGSKQDVRPYLKVSNIGLGVGRVAMEMLSSKMALVCSSHQAFGGLFTEENSDEISAYNFSGRNTKNISSSENIEKEIVKYLNLNEDEKEKLEIFGRTFIKSRYTLDVIIKDTKDMFNDVINRRKN